MVRLEECAASLLVACLGRAAPRRRPTATKPSVRAGLPVDLRRGTLWPAGCGKPAGRGELRLVVRAGSVLERPDRWGGAPVEHMASTAPATFQSGVIAFLESAGVSFGSHLNAYTSYDEAVYMLQVPPIARAVPTSRCSTTGQKASSSTKRWSGHGVVLEEWRSTAVRAPAPGGHPPGALRQLRLRDRDVIGTEASLKAMTVGLVDFYETWYRPELMAVVVVGDSTLQPCEQIEASFVDRNPRVHRHGCWSSQDGVRVLSQADPERAASSISLLETTPWRWPPTKRASSSSSLRISPRHPPYAPGRALAGGVPFLAAGAGYEDLNRVQGFRTTPPGPGREGAGGLGAVLAEVTRQAPCSTSVSSTPCAATGSTEQDWLQTEDRPFVEQPGIIRHFLDDEWMAGTEGEMASTRHCYTITATTSRRPHPAHPRPARARGGSWADARVHR